MVEGPAEISVMETVKVEVQRLPKPLDVLPVLLSVNLMRIGPKSLHWTPSFQVTLPNPLVLGDGPLDGIPQHSDGLHLRQALLNALRHGRMIQIPRTRLEILRLRSLIFYEFEKLCIPPEGFVVLVVEIMEFFLERATLRTGV
jgi:hypothetical protein